MWNGLFIDLGSNPNSAVRTPFSEKAIQHMEQYIFSLGVCDRFSHKPVFAEILTHESSIHGS